MNKMEFARRVKANKMRGAQVDAARLVLLHGMGVVAAAAQAGVHKSGCSRAVDRIQRPLCPECGQVIR